MRWRIILAVLAVSASFFGCRSEKDETVPDELIGVWKTSAPGYEDNSLELKKDEILFGVGHSQVAVSIIYRVKTVRLAGEKNPLITIYFTDEEGKDNASSLYYDPTPPGSIRFKNQMKIEWRLSERRPAGKPSPSRHRRAGSWWRGSRWDVALALLGVAMIAGAVLWRLRVPRPEKPAAAPASARQMRGGREPGDRGGAPGDAGWTQAPALIPAIAAREQRRSERILLKIPVHVAGTDARGESFAERTFTFSINRHGAFLWLKNSPREGGQVTVTNLGTRRSCAFRLCDSGKEPSSQVTAWGLECLEPNSNFWQIRFPEKPLVSSPEKTIAALVVCASCRSREVADLSVAQYRMMLERGSIKRDCSDCGVVTVWKFIPVEVARPVNPEEAPAVGLPSGKNNRREKRILAKLPIRLRDPEDGRIENTLTENVSKSGVCCVAGMELNVGDVILLRFEPGTGPSDREVPARIVWLRSMGEIRRTLYGIRLKRKKK